MDSSTARDVATVPDGDRNLTIWSWLRPVARPTAIVLGLALGVGGCTALPGDGPWMGGAQSGSTEALPFDVIDLTPTTVVAYRQPESPDHPSTVPATCRPACASPSRPATAEGAHLRALRRQHLSDHLGHGRRSRRPARGRGRHDQGARSWASCTVAGLDLTQVEDRIIQQLGNKVQEPEVIVDFDAPPHPDRDGVGRRQEARALVHSRGHPHRGRCHQRRRAARRRRQRLTVPANQLEVVVRRQGQVILRAQLSDLLAGADIPVQKGDEIVVRPNPRVYTVLGAVLKSGNVEMTKPISACWKRLGNVGGLQDQRANKTGVYVFRMGDLLNNPTARARVFRLDLFQPVSIFVAQQFGVQARDVMYVTNAPLYEYDKILTLDLPHLLDHRRGQGQHPHHDDRSDAEPSGPRGFLVEFRMAQAKKFTWGATGVAVLAVIGALALWIAPSRQTSSAQDGRPAAGAADFARLYRRSGRHGGRRRRSGGWLRRPRVARQGWPEGQARRDHRRAVQLSQGRRGSAHGRGRPDQDKAVA